MSWGLPLSFTTRPRANEAEKSAGASCSLSLTLPESFYTLHHFMNAIKNTGDKAKKQADLYVSLFHAGSFLELV